MSVEIKWNEYEVGLGFGCWLRSRENGVCEGDVRFLAGHLMSAWQVHKRWFSRDEVWWTPVDRDVRHSAEAMRAWRASL